MVKENNYREALTQIDEILKFLPSEYQEKLPSKVYTFIKENKDENYNFAYNPRKSFEEQDFMQETEVFLAIFLLKYWDKENKKQLLAIYEQNEKKFEEEQREKYPVDVFENVRKITQVKDCKDQQMLILKKENVFAKFFRNFCNFIKNILPNH